MLRLRDAYKGERAAVILGGPSLIEQGFDFEQLRKKNMVVILESKALTPWYLTHGVTPDFYLMLFPMTSKGNTLHFFIYRALLSGFNMGGTLKPPFREVWDQVQKDFSKYFEPWNPKRGVCKRYKWKADAFIQDSPYDLVPRIPESKIITNRRILAEYFPGFRYTNPMYYFEQTEEMPEFNLDSYYTPRDKDGVLQIESNSFINSSAIVLYPLLKYMGFQDVYFLGMDMSMMGTMEYAAPFTFRSLAHFWWYFMRTRSSFNTNFKMNFPFYWRPKHEFDELRLLFNHPSVNFKRVYEPYRYAKAVPYLPTLSLREFRDL